MNQPTTSASNISRAPFGHHCLDVTSTGPWELGLRADDDEVRADRSIGMTGVHRGGHYGTLVDGAHASIADRLDALEEGRGRPFGTGLAQMPSPLTTRQSPEARRDAG